MSDDDNRTAVSLGECSRCGAECTQSAFQVGEHPDRFACFSCVSDHELLFLMSGPGKDAEQ